MTGFIPHSNNRDKTQNNYSVSLHNLCYTIVWSQVDTKTEQNGWAVWGGGEGEKSKMIVSFLKDHFPHLYWYLFQFSEFTVISICI